MEHILEWIEYTSLGIEILAIMLIIVAIVSATARYLLEITLRTNIEHRYEHYKHSLGKGLLLGLEILVAADVVRTVALEPGLANVAVLGLLILIRTFLSWSLLLEIEGRWPWQPRKQANPPDRKV